MNESSKRKNDAAGVGSGGLFCGLNDEGRFPAGQLCPFAGSCEFKVGCNLAENGPLKESFSCAEARIRSGFWTRHTRKQNSHVHPPQAGCDESSATDPDHDSHDEQTYDERP